MTDAAGNMEAQILSESALNCLEYVAEAQSLGRLGSLCLSLRNPRAAGRFTFPAAVHKHSSFSVLPSTCSVPSFSIIPILVCVNWYLIVILILFPSC